MLARCGRCAGRRSRTSSSSRSTTPPSGACSTRPRYAIGRSCCSCLTPACGSLKGFLFLAVVVDAWSRAVVGWAMAGHLRTELIINALEMALWRRPAASGVIFHSARGGINRSSQHLEMEVVDDGCSNTAASGAGDTWPDVVAGATINRAARGSDPVLAGDRAGRLDRERRHAGRRVSGRRGALVPSGWRHAAHLVGPGLGALPLVLRARGDRDPAGTGGRRAGHRAAPGTCAVDHQPRAAPQRRHARRTGGLSGLDCAVARRAPRQPSKAIEAGGPRSPARLRATVWPA